MNHVKEYDQLNPMITESPDRWRRQLRREVLDHLETFDITSSSGKPSLGDTKEHIRLLHATQRKSYARQEIPFLEAHGWRLLPYFAAGDEVRPEAIDPVLVLVTEDSLEAHLFRMASLLWSIPLSRGFGRRIRFVVIDRHNGKLIGLLALCSPVFNLRDRDAWIGWDQGDRRQRLTSVMDAYVLGAVPPYAHLLGGKLVGALATAAEVQQVYQAKYERPSQEDAGSPEEPLVLITTTSALGRSSLYNRLRLPGLCAFHRVGWTQGWGHFHVPEPIFQNMRRLLRKLGHDYADGYTFEDGPNWRFRVIRKALEEVGLDPSLLRHGIRREVFAAPLAKNCKAFLTGQDQHAEVQRPSVAALGGAALERWMVPRAQRRPEYKAWTRQKTWRLITKEIAFAASAAR